MILKNSNRHGKISTTDGPKEKAKAKAKASRKAAKAKEGEIGGTATVK